MTKFIVILSFVLSTGLLASNPNVNGFFKHFKLKKDSKGRVVQIIDESLISSFKIAPYVSFIKKALISEQERMLSKNNYDVEVFKTLGVDPSLKDSKDIEKARVVLKSLRQLEGIDVNKVFKSKQMNSLLVKFEGKLSEILASLDPRVIADLDQSDFFYKRNVTYKIVNWALNYAKKKFSSVPILNTASFVVVKVEEMIRKKRLFHQNMLLHYLENFSETELGMTHDEVNRTISSIYESRIEWFAIWESNAVKANWKKYGINTFFTNLRTANTRLRQTRSLKKGQRINFAFQEAWIDGQHVILNLFNTANKYDQKLAIAHYYDKPQKIKRQRMMLELAQLGLSYVTAPDWLKGMAEDYMKSFYKEQELTEGSLLAYFETMGNTPGMNLVKNQYMNPFDAI